jgi:hypothetical protein
MVAALIVGFFEMRHLRADKLLVENIRTLLYRRGVDQKALAVWCQHKPAWINKILKGERGLPMDELGMVADFFGLRADQLLSPGISPLAERRHTQRRALQERRSGAERRHGRQEGDLHPDVQDRFRHTPAPTEPASAESRRRARVR